MGDAWEKEEEEEGEVNREVEDGPKLHAEVIRGDRLGSDTVQKTGSALCASTGLALRINASSQLSALSSVT